MAFGRRQIFEQRTANYSRLQHPEGRRFCVRAPKARRAYVSITQKGPLPMATHNYVLTDPPGDQRARELWLQHGAGFIIFQDIRQYAIDAIPATYGHAQREA